MRVVVDQSRCQGHVRCDVEAPGFFSFDRNGHNDSNGLEVPEQDQAALRRAVLACPENALSLEE